MKNWNKRDKTADLFTIDSFLQMIPAAPHDLTRICFEVAGKDSVAALIPIMEKILGLVGSTVNKQHNISEIIGFAMYHHGLYGNFNEPIEHFKKIQLLIQKRFGEIPMRFFYVNVAELFEWAIIQPMAIIQKYFRAYSPCPACHLFFHMMRVPLVNHIGSSTLISGERSAHENHLKLNQLPEILSLFPTFLQNHHVSLIQPLFDYQKDEEIFQLLGDFWETSDPFQCIFSNNYLDETGNIPFQIPQVIQELQDFYYPLFSKIIYYIKRTNTTPSHSWIKQEIAKLLSCLNTKKQN